MSAPLLTITGLVASPRSFTFDDLAAILAEHQIQDVSRLVPGRQGDAVRLRGLFDLVQPKSGAEWLSLHAAADNFHASIPLAAVLDRAIVIYRLAGQPLSPKSGGPIRFFIPDFAACHTADIDECANVKFVDTLELTAARGLDNRPHDGAAHEALHVREGEAPAEP